MDESWVSVAQYSDPASAQVASGRLASESIPSAVSRPAFSAGLYYVRVPPRSLDAAQEILKTNENLDVQELTELALSTPAPDDYVPPRPSTSGDVPSRRVALMMLPLVGGLVFLISAGIFGMSLITLVTKGEPLPRYCGAGGCWSLLTVSITSGLMTLLSLGMVLASLNRED